MKYAIWNNKGGVGKTFLTFCMAVEYAKLHPKKNIVIIDMCPQANVSTMLLGGNGKGEKNLEKLHNTDKTIASYIQRRYRENKSEKLGTELSYFVEIYKYNKNLPKNMYLLTGDPDLDICSILIDYMAQAPEKHAWINSRQMLDGLIESFDKAHTGSDNTFFIDCNPSFANYTQMSILSATRLIVPCAGDFASLQGVNNIFKLIYGYKSEESPFTSFYDNIQKSINKGLPQIHCFILNKTRTNAGNTKGYEAHVKKINTVIKEFEQTFPKYFTPISKNQRILSVKDANNIALVINYNGLPVSELQHKQYDIYGELSQVNQTQIDALKEHVKNLINVL